MRVLLSACIVLVLAGCVSTAHGRGSVVPPVTVSTRALGSSLESAGRLGGVALDADGNVYVSNFGSKVWKVLPSGRIELLTDSLNGSSGNTIDRNGRLVQSSFVDGRLVAFDRSGTMTTLVDGGLSGPVGVAANDDGDLIVCNCRGHSLSSVSTAGVVRTLASGPLFDCPNGITAGPGGAMYVVNFNNSHVLRVDAGGGVTIVATLPDGGNAHIAYARGAFYVTRIATHEIVRVRLNGSFDRWVGNGTGGLTDGPADTATLARPNGIAASADGSFVVFNDLDGVWRGPSPTRILLRQVGPIPDPGKAPPPAEASGIEPERR